MSSSYSGPITQNYGLFVEPHPRQVIEVTSERTSYGAKVTGEPHPTARDFSVFGSAFNSHAVGPARCVHGEDVSISDDMCQLCRADRILRELAVDETRREPGMGVVLFNLALACGASVGVWLLVSGSIYAVFDPIIAVAMAVAFHSLRRRVFA